MKLLEFMGLSVGFGGENMVFFCGKKSLKICEFLRKMQKNSQILREFFAKFSKKFTEFLRNFANFFGNFCAKSVNFLDKTFLKFSLNFTKNFKFILSKKRIAIFKNKAENSRQIYGRICKQICAQNLGLNLAQNLRQIFTPFNTQNSPKKFTKRQKNERH